MTRLHRQIRQTLTIARRDFIATVFTPVFLLFLFAPLIMVSFSSLGALGAINATKGNAQAERIVAILPPGEARALAAADARLRPLLGGDHRPPSLQLRPPEGDPEAQARRALTNPHVDVAAVLRGSLDRPVILHDAGDGDAARYLAAAARDAALALRAPVPGEAVLERVARAAPSPQARGASGFFAVFGIFFLTLFLSGQVVGTMAEERNNKVIEVLAAAVPLESVFLGKLLGMFGVALLFVAFWGVVVTQVGALLPGDMGADLAALAPAVGKAGFVMLFGAYFTTAYLLLGSVFLGVGAQASTMREIQMLSLPITVLQVAMFALASAAVANPGTPLALAAELFPLSSPFAMAGRAASSPEVWPHVAALAWQLLWVSLFIVTGARAFRRGVLQSGSARPAWRSRIGRRFFTIRRKTIDTDVS
ncbi:ABC transporter permease [Sphingomonas adhaesiva]|uniref:ABC transporter permease n=1 Tax=Sphingomonas adhaesiva TaxID=28212 RepID=UPI002FF7B924